VQIKGNSVVKLPETFIVFFVIKSKFCNRKPCSSTFSIEVMNEETTQITILVSTSNYFHHHHLLSNIVNQLLWVVKIVYGCVTGMNIKRKDMG
jgi:hypothetical protein